MDKSHNRIAEFIEEKINAQNKREAMTDSEMFNEMDAKIDSIRAQLTRPKREWVGLTDEEVWECYSDQGSVFYRAVEAKLKEKNNG